MKKIIIHGLMAVTCIGSFAETVTNNLGGGLLFTLSGVPPETGAVVTNVTALRTIKSPDNGDIALVLSRDGGIFYYHSTSTATENGGDYCGTVVREKDHVGAGRWLRLFDSTVYASWFGAGEMADDAVAIQAAVDLGMETILPPGNLTVSTVTISKQMIVRGAGMDNTIILPITGYSTFIVAKDKVELRDFEFQGKTGSGQANITGDCIKFDAVTHNPLFARAMEGCKVTRVGFQNLKMNGIYVPHVIREGHITECRFVGMGDAASDRSAIKMLPSLGNAANINNIRITGNMFYRFNNPAINLKASTTITNGAASYVDIILQNNLIHGQLMDESLKPEGQKTAPEPCDHILIKNGSNIFINHNNITAIHPEYYGVRVEAAGTASKLINVSHNAFALKGTIGTNAYSRAAGDATGGFMKLWGSETFVVEGNEMTAGIFVDDIILNNGSYTTPVEAQVYGNVSQGGIITVNRTGLGQWTGRVNTSEMETTTVQQRFEADVTMEGHIEMDTGGPTIVSGAGTPEAVVAAPKGSIYLSTDGAFYVKESGGTSTQGWVEKQ